MTLKSGVRKPDTITIARDVWLGVLWLLAAQILKGIHDQWFDWWVLTPLAATAQTTAVIRLALYAVRRRRRQEGS